jgi:hypothetical protein
MERRKLTAALAVAAIAIAAAVTIPLATGGASSTEVVRLQARYVDAASGSDSNTGRTPDAAYATIARALRDIPTVPEAHWTVNLAAGDYHETVRLDRFVMPTGLAAPLLSDTNEPAASIELAGPTGGGARLVPAPGESCLIGSSVIVFLYALECAASGGDAALFADSTIVADDVSFDAAAETRSALLVERSTLMLGGHITFTGPFKQALAIRTFSLVRPGTRRMPAGQRGNVLPGYALAFDGPTEGIFLRDRGTFTNLFNSNTITFDHVPRPIVALFMSDVYIGYSDVRLTGAATAFEAQQGSGINTSQTPVAVDGADTLAYCTKTGWIVIENGTYTGIKQQQYSDGSCKIQT